MNDKEMRQLEKEWKEMMEVWEASPISQAVMTGGMRDGLTMLVWLELRRVRKTLEKLEPA